MSSNGSSKVATLSNTNSLKDELCNLAELETKIKKEIESDEIIENNFTSGLVDASNHVKEEVGEHLNGQSGKVKAEQIKNEIKLEPVKDEIKEEGSDSSDGDDEDEEEEEEEETSSDSDGQFVVSLCYYVENFCLREAWSTGLGRLGSS